MSDFVFEDVTLQTQQDLKVLMNRVIGAWESWVVRLTNEQVERIVKKSLDDMLYIFNQYIKEYIEWDYLKEEITNHLLTAPDDLKSGKELNLGLKLYDFVDLDDLTFGIEIRKSSFIKKQKVYYDKESTDLIFDIETFITKHSSAKKITLTSGNVIDYEKELEIAGKNTTVNVYLEPAVHCELNTNRILLVFKTLEEPKIKITNVANIPKPIVNTRNVRQRKTTR